jgi:hypothetical protein
VLGVFLVVVPVPEMEEEMVVPLVVVLVEEQVVQQVVVWEQAALPAQVQAELPERALDPVQAAE